MTQPTPMPPDEARRVRQGASLHAEPEVLKKFASDASITVRVALAQNPAAPPEADLVLAHDPDERVRAVLARKLAMLIPEMDSREQVRLQQQTYATLTALVADQAVRVRLAIADVVKDMAEAPRALILRLAQDEAVMISGPIIRLSPLLTNQDLLALIAAASSSAAVTAVATRKGIDEQVSDAIAATANSAAIRALLANPSAQIREATLDALIARAVDHVEWHEPLVHRPALPPHASRALADIVATDLLQVLVQRADVSPELGELLRARLAEQLTAADHLPPAAQVERSMDDALAEARRLAKSGLLDEEAILQASSRGDARFGAALLAIAAGIPVAVVDRAASLRSAKGLVSLAWKAGFSMRAAAALQTLLGRLPPDATLPAGPGGCFPLAIDEMRWQLEFLAQLDRS